MTKEFFERGKQIAEWADNNMTKDEALKDLLEIVEHAIKVNDWKVDGACDPEIIINRAKEALEQPNLTYEDGFTHGYEAHRAEQALEQPYKYNPETGEPLIDGYPLYSYMPAPPWQGLSDDEIYNIADKHGMVFHVWWEQYGRAIEQALKEKNNAV